VKLYLAGKTKAHGKSRKNPASPSVGNHHFDAADLVFEAGTIKILRDGRCEIHLFVPYDHVAEALKLRASYGMLLQGRISPVRRKAP
jgi:hypothetical protein